MDEISQKLKRPFDPKALSWRVGATNGDKTQGIALAYIDARDVMQRLDDVMGLNWQCKYSHANGKTICDLALKLDGEWIWRAGGAGDTDVEAEKGAISDAFKRAAVLFGIGRYLYSLPNKWVPIKAAGRSYALAETPSLPGWATPEGFDALMEKRARAGGIITPKSDTWEQLDVDVRTWLMDLAGEVRAMLKNGKVKEAIAHIASQNMGADERVAFDSRLDSTERSAIKKYQDSLKQKEAA